MKRRAFTLSALSLLGAQLAVTRGTVSAAADPVKIGVGSAYPTYAIFYAARELGYYAAANIDAAIQAFPSGSQALDAVAAGTLDLCSIAPPALAAAIGKGVKAQIVAMFAPPRPAGWSVMVLPGSPLESPADLQGKTVGVTQTGTLGDIWLQQAAKRANISVTSVPLGGGVLAGLQASKVDAVVLAPPASYKGFLSGDLREVLHLETAVPPSVPEGVCASADFIKRRPDVLRRALAATSKAVSYMQANERWTEKFLTSYLADTDDASIAMVYKDFIMKIGPAGDMHADWKKTALDLAPSSAALLPANSVFSTAFVPIKKR